MSEASNGAAEELDDDTLAKLSDYVEGTLPAAERAALEARLADEPHLRAELDEVKATMGALKSIDKPRAPGDLGKTVEETIHRRSAGRFFGRKTLGDRVPFGVLLIVALLGLIVLVWLLWSSSTGSLRTEHKDRTPPPPAARDAIPHPR